MGYSHMISGFDDGADLLFAEVVIEAKKDYPNITLEAAIPYRGRMKAKNAELQRLLGQCDKVTVVSENYYNGCFLNRNRYMLESSDAVFAVYDGRERGGTFFTLNIARKSGKEIIVIET